MLALLYANFRSSITQLKKKKTVHVIRYGRQDGLPGSWPNTNHYNTETHDFLMKVETFMVHHTESDLMDPGI